MLAGMLLVLGGIAVAVGATFGWIAVVVSPGTSSALTRAAAVLSGAFGLLLLVGLWGIHGAEKPPPFDWLLLLYPTGLAGSFPLLWPWNDEFST